MSVNVVSGVSQGSVLESLLFIFYTSKLFHIVGSYIVGYVNDTTIYSWTTQAPSSDGIAESRFGSNQHLVFEVAHETQP